MALEKFCSLIVVLVGLMLLAACLEDRPTTGDGRPTTEVENPAAQITRIPPVAPPAESSAPPPAGETPTLPPEPTVTTPPEVVATATPERPLQPVTTIQLTSIASGFRQPLFLTHAFDERLFVVEKDGRIQIIENGEVRPDPFLDINERVGSQGSEQGLFSLAFHPDYARNGRFFVYYTDTNGDTVVSRFQVSVDNPNAADPDSETIVLRAGQPYANHNGGQLQFGPDGYLYIGLGDGGSGGDPHNHGQDVATLLGSLLRISVDGDEPYAIPADNPFVSDGEARPETWAYGLRNPWRFSFDRLTGDLYIADVGQGNWEEVSFQPAGSPGGENYGWNIMEGTHCFREDDCDAVGLVRPVAEYNHDFGCSITGGYVYRGSTFPALQGNYFFGDYCSGIIWSLFRQEDGSWAQNAVLESGRSLSSFGEDAAGEVYLTTFDGGEILRLEP